MNTIKCYVGLENKFVLCETFPDDEEHWGLHGMLEEWSAYNEFIFETPLEQGFYLLSFEITRGRSHCYLSLVKMEKIGDI